MKKNLRILSLISIILVVFSTTFGLPAFMSLDEFSKIAGLFGHTDKLMLEQISSRRALFVGTASTKPTNVLSVIMMQYGDGYQERCHRKRTSRGSRARHAATNSLNGLEKFPSSVGGGFFGIKNNTCKKDPRFKLFRLLVPNI